VSPVPAVCPASGCDVSADDDDVLADDEDVLDLVLTLGADEGVDV